MSNNEQIFAGGYDLEGLLAGKYGWVQCPDCWGSRIIYKCNQFSNEWYAAKCECYRGVIRCSTDATLPKEDLEYIQGLQS